MKNMYLEKTINSPEIKLDYGNGTMTFSGMSLPEDTREFYVPILNWIKQYFQQPQEKTLITFDFAYFNSSSSKMIHQIILEAKAAWKDGKNVEIQWLYPQDDDDMEEAGEDFAEVTKMPIKIFAVEAA